MATLETELKKLRESIDKQTAVMEKSVELLQNQINEMEGLVKTSVPPAPPVEADTQEAPPPAPPKQQEAPAPPTPPAPPAPPAPPTTPAPPTPMPGATAISAQDLENKMIAVSEKLGDEGEACGQILTDMKVAGIAQMTDEQRAEACGKVDALIP